MNLQQQAVAHLGEWLEVQRATPERVGAILRSDLPCCPKCDVRMELKHSRRDNTWAIKHPLFTSCDLWNLPGLWRESEELAIKDYLTK